VKNWIKLHLSASQPMCREKSFVLGKKRETLENKEDQSEQ
jgi:hypothetical protein